MRHKSRKSSSFSEVKEAHQENIKRGMYIYNLIYIYIDTHSLTVALLLLQLHLLKLHAVFTAFATAHGTTPFFLSSNSLYLSHTLLLISLNNPLPKRSPLLVNLTSFPSSHQTTNRFFPRLCKRHAARPKKTLSQSHWSKRPDPMHCTCVSTSQPCSPPLPSPHMSATY